MNQKLFLNDLKLDHIAYAVRSTDKSIASFKFIYPNILVYKCIEKSQNVFITYLSNNNIDCKIELVESAEGLSSASKLLAHHDISMYHICYEVEDLAKAIKSFKKNGFFMITKPYESTVKQNFSACHFYNPFAGMVELMGLT